VELLLVAESQQNARIIDKYLNCILTKYSIVLVSAGGTLLREIYTGRFIIFSAITNIYNKKIKGPTIVELFTATGKLKKFLF